MIWESGAWKEELQKEFKSFSKFLTEIKTSENEYFNLRVEKFFFVSAFIIRKLNESNKLSDELTSKDFIYVKYNRIRSDAIVDFLNFHHFDRFYDLKREEKCLLKSRDICNYFIHSFIFSTVHDENGQLCGVLVNSDRTKDEFLLYVELNTFTELINDVIDDDIVSMSYNRITGAFKKSNVAGYDSNTS
ncbi:MAG: hypothetical protein WBA22_10545 [Candidatus Methanofastidiosia archaeon]